MLGYVTSQTGQASKSKKWCLFAHLLVFIFKLTLRFGSGIEMG